MKKYRISDSRGDFNARQFDSKFNEVIANDRTFGSLAYDQVKHISVCLCSMSNPRHSAVFIQLGKNSIPVFAGVWY